MEGSRRNLIYFWESRVSHDVECCVAGTMCRRCRKRLDRWSSLLPRDICAPTTFRHQAANSPIEELRWFYLGPGTPRWWSAKVTSNENGTDMCRRSILPFPHSVCRAYRWPFGWWTNGRWTVIAENRPTASIRWSANTWLVSAACRIDGVAPSRRSPFCWYRAAVRYCTLPTM